MLGTYIFAGITVGAVLFMARFLIAICGPNGKPAPVAYLARVAPEHDGPPGFESDGRKDRFNSEDEACVHSRRPAPVHAQREHPRRATGWRRFVARRARRTRSEG